MSDTGRFYIIMKSGRKFCVEPLHAYNQGWGNINPATKKLEIVTSKYIGSIDPKDSIITKENGFKNICVLEPGTSPIGFIEALDSSGVERIESPYVKYLDDNK